MTQSTRIAFAVTPILPALTICIYLAGDAQYGPKTALLDFIPVYLFFLCFALITGIPALHILNRLRWKSALHYTFGAALIGIATLPPVMYLADWFIPTYSAVFSLEFFIDCVFLTAATGLIFHAISSSGNAQSHDASTE